MLRRGVSLPHVPRPPRRIFRLEALFLYLILKTAIFLCYNRKVNMRYSPLSAEYTAGREVATVEI